MKKLFWFVFIFNLSFVFSQSETIQSVSPKNFYVADSVQVRYSFKSGVDFFSDLDKNIFQRELKISNLPGEWKTEDFSVKRIFLTRTSEDYTLVLDFVPWKTGMIVFPPFDLYFLVYEKSNVPFNINLNPVEVSSILSNKYELKGVHGPKLVPGTVYVILALIILLVLLVIFSVSVILKWKKVVFALKNLKMRMIYAKNSARSKAFLKKLLKNKKCSDQSFAQNIQHEMRRYLSVRFSRNFYSVETSRIFSVFDEIFLGMTSDFLCEQLENLVFLFARTDYIQFAFGSVDSKRLPQKEFSASFQEGERKTLIDVCLNFINEIARKLN